jgi:hypothetical protein
LLKEFFQRGEGKRLGKISVGALGIRPAQRLCVDATDDDGHGVHGGKSPCALHNVSPCAIGKREIGDYDAEGRAREGIAGLGNRAGRSHRPATLRDPRGEGLAEILLVFDEQAEVWPRDCVNVRVHGEKPLLKTIMS